MVTRIVSSNKAKVLSRQSRLSQRFNSFHRSSYNNHTNLADTGVLAFLIPLFPVSTSNTSSSDVSSNNFDSDINKFIKQKLQKNIQNNETKVPAPKGELQHKGNICAPSQKDKQYVKSKDNEKEGKNTQNSSDTTNDISPNVAKETARGICDTTRTRGIEQDIDKIFIGEGWQHLKTYNLNTHLFMEVPRSGL